MLKLIQKDRIEDLSLEMIIYYMFKEYPEIISGYNNEVIPLFREYNMIDAIDNLRESLINVNTDSIDNGENPGDEKIFVDSIIGMYNDLIKEKKSVDSMRLLSNRIRIMKEEETNFLSSEKNNAEQIVEELDIF